MIQDEDDKDDKDDKDCRIHFRDDSLKGFFKYGSNLKDIPENIRSRLAQKLDMLNAAKEIKDLNSPPGNRLKKLKAPMNNYYSIRVNSKYRLIFKWDRRVKDLYLDPHNDV